MGIMSKAAGLSNKMKCKACGGVHYKGHPHFKLSGADAVKMAMKKVKAKAMKHKKVKPEKGESKDHELSESNNFEAQEDKKKRIRHKKPKLGSGKRFAQLKNKLGAKGAKNPGALTAWIGRKKYGAKRFAKLSAKGKKNA